MSGRTGALLRPWALDGAPIPAAKAIRRKKRLEELAPLGLEVGSQTQLAIVPAARPRWASRGELKGWEDGVLGNTVSRVSPPALLPKALNRVQKRKRNVRMALRHFGRDLSHHGLVSRCGHQLSRDKGVSLMRGADGRTFFSGLVRCGSVWECPVCAQAISMGRAEELKTLLTRHRTYGGSAYMATLTIPHDQGDELKPMRLHVSRGWQYVQGGAPWKRMKKKLGIIGTVRALELKHGANGWHPHLHVVLCTAGALTAAQLAEFQAWLLERWRKAIARPVKGSDVVYREPSEEHGVTVLASNQDTYIAKMGLADELAHGAFKDSDNGRRTPFKILFDAWSNPGTGEQELRAIRDVALWLEYAREMHGARQLTWSKGLRERYELEEQTDLELSAEEEKQPAVELFAFVRSDWDRMIRYDLQLQLALLDAGAAEWPPGEVTDSVTRLLDAARGLEPLPF